MYDPLFALYTHKFLLISEFLTDFQLIYRIIVKILLKYSLKN